VETELDKRVHRVAATGTLNQDQVDHVKQFKLLLLQRRGSYYHITAH